jgi:hypothetical protein
VTGPPGLTLTLDVSARVGPPVELGAVPGGRRRLVPITGGTFAAHGELSIAGRIVPGGADTQLVHDDGLTEADARYTLETTDGTRIGVRNRGLRHAPPDVMRRLLAGERVDPALVYFMTTPVFETDAPGLQLLVRSIFVGSGERYPDEVVLQFWKVG